jgi:ubiquinol-cytochrome c reductase cytochrome c1 subunit
MAIRRLLCAAALGLGLGAAAPAGAAEAPDLPTRHWSFDGFFGTYDRAALQRGFEVYKGVCSACHSLDLVAYRNLADIGYSADDVKNIAAGATVQDGPNDEGAMFERPGKPSDHIPPPFPNEQASRAANGGAHPPDLSLMAKARDGGADYIHAVLTGYGEAPADLHVPDGLYYNAYFPGHMIAMPPPLSEGAVTYTDGTTATVEQMSSDVAQFLTWTAEPKLEDRKRTGVKVILFLFVLTAMLYAVKRKVWSDLH